MQNSVISVGGEVIVPSSGESSEDIARASVVGKPGIIIGGDLNVIRPSEQIDPVFLALAISNGTPNRNMAKRAQGKSVVHLHNSDLREVNLVFPKIEEQTKIGSFFKELEKTITLHKRKYKALLKLKEAYLQNMFPAKDESVPKVRFANFGGDWEQRKLGEIAEFNPKSTLPNEFEYVDLESVIGTYLVTHRTEKKSTAPSRAQRLAQKGDVFYQTVRPYQKNNYLYDLPYDNFVFSTGYAQMRPNIDSYFLLSHIQGEKFVKRVLDRCTGTSYPAINSTDLAEINIQVPTKLDEQIQIGKFFKDIENIITLHQQKLEKSNLLKEAYLQRMLI